MSDPGPAPHPGGEASPDPAGTPAPRPAPPSHLAPHPAYPPPYGWGPRVQPPGYPPAPYAPPPGAGHGRSRPALPAWAWVLVVVAALGTGLLGGLVGGLAVGGGAATGGETALPPIDSAQPLDPDNTSIATVAAKVLPSTVQVRVLNGKGDQTTGATGSGFVVDRRGHVITNNHVVAALKDGGTVEVVDSTGTVHKAEIVGRSPTYDVAVLSVGKAKGLPPAALGSAKRMRVGETVVAIGSPLGLSSTVTSGIVSAVDRPVTTGSTGSSSYIDAVQTDAAINPGNSGGPLVNLRGQVVGMNSAIATTGGFGEAGNIGVGFAIPMEQVRQTAGQILRTGEAEYPVIGASVNTGDTTTSDGAEVAAVPSGTPADRAGLRKGDRIVAVDGKRVQDGISLIVAIRSHRPGEVIELTFVRDGEERVVKVTLDAKVG